MTTNKITLPALKDLYDGDLPLKQGQNELNLLLNQPPNPAWIKEHPFAKGVKYIPIERIEYLLTRLFIKWRVEVKQIQTIANSCVVTIRLHYQNIEDNDWSWQDGIGAAPIQTEKDAGAMEWDRVRTDSVMKSAPAAESYAVKDAAEKIGKIFGKDMNRKDTIIYDSLADAIPEERITLSQFGYAEELVRKSTLDDDQKDKAYAELANPELTMAEFQAIKNKLVDAQPKDYSKTN
jgi:hypothetical protein